ncbi:MAG: hypothetical protein V4529_16640 [Gemmatimonadota bacterium]
MLQTLTTYGAQAALILGYVSGGFTCLNGIVSVLGAGDTKVGHGIAAVGVDVAKLYRLVAGLVSPVAK